MNNALRVAGWTLAALLAGGAFLIAFRWVALIFLAICLLLIVLRQSLRTRCFATFILSGFFLCCFQPFDISFESRTGLPRVVPAIYGKPSRATMEKAKRGEVLLRGCEASGFEPDWLLVW
jgi:hypothetical protein